MTPPPFSLGPVKLPDLSSVPGASLQSISEGTVTVDGVAKPAIVATFVVPLSLIEVPDGL
jgi:hypothetical protein